MRVTAYARVSTRRQALGDSVEAQEEAIRGWAEEGNHEVVAVHRDNGRSGTLDETERPALLEALNLIKDGGADALVVTDLDRLSRKLHVQEAVLSQVWGESGEVWEARVDRRVLRDDPEDPVRTFVRQVTAAAHQLERAQVVRRLQGARRRKADRGGWSGGQVPYGWRSVGRRRDAKLVGVPAEQAVIRRMRRMRRRGRTLRQLADRLNADGVPAKGGSRWRHTSVRSVLQSATHRVAAKRRRSVHGWRVRDAKKCSSRGVEAKWSRVATPRPRGRPQLRPGVPGRVRGRLVAATAHRDDRGAEAGLLRSDGGPRLGDAAGTGRSERRRGRVGSLVGADGEHPREPRTVRARSPQ